MYIHRSCAIERLRTVSNVATDVPIGLAYFYCSYDMSEASELRNILCSVAAQLIRCCHEPEVGPAMRLFQDCDDGTMTPSVTRAQTLIMQLIGRMKSVFICLDALDECKAITKSELLHFIFEIIGQCENVKILVSSRIGDSEVHEALDGCSSFTISQVAVAQDIECFLRFQIEHGPKRLRLASSDSMVKRLVRGAEGM